jgi:hypothetical protein
MLRRAVLVRTDDSEERIASIIRVKRIGEVGSTLILVTLVMVAIHSFESSVLTRATRRNIPEDGTLRSTGQADHFLDTFIFEYDNIKVNAQYVSSCLADFECRAVSQN